jgi:hypothetical protein
MDAADMSYAAICRILEAPGITPPTESLRSQFEMFTRFRNDCNNLAHALGAFPHETTIV